MDPEQIGSIVIFLVCVVLSAFFSASETAFTSIRRAKLEVLSRNGDNRAEKTLDLYNKYEDLLSTILIGNNIVNIAASSVATLFFVKMFPLYGALISTIVTTIFLLVFSEISPKLVAKLIPEDLALAVTPILKFIMVILTPVVWLISKLQLLIKKIIPNKEEINYSEDILLHYVDEAKVEGSIEEDEHSLVKRAMEFDDETISTIIIPRVDVISVDVDDTDEEIEAVFDEYSYSRVIVYEETIDKILGIIHEKDFTRYLKKKNRQGIADDIRTIISDLLYVPGTIKLSEALKLMQKEKLHMAAIIDEHGGFEGIVTMEDILEELVGDIWDESDEIEQDIRALVKNKVFEINGRIDLDDAFEFLNLELKEEFHSNTLSGFMIQMLDKMPEENEEFIYENYMFSVKEIENNRITKVKVTRLDS